MPMPCSIAASIDASVLIVVVAGVAGAVLIALFAAVRGVLQIRETERTRRELAAYVAEGSISPEDAEKILGPQQAPTGDFEKTLGNAVSWGTVSPEKAERLIKAYRSREA